MNNKTNRPSISVVMPTYNGEAFIAKAIQSVLNQTFTDFELIIVNDGSTDATASIIASFDDSRILYIKKETNTGIADCLNIGIKVAKGTYFARMDDDDTCDKERLLQQIRYLETHKNVIVCATNDQNRGGNRPYLSNLQIKIGLMFRNVLIHASVMMPMSIFNNYKYNVDKVPSEDYDLWSRILKEGEFHKLSDPLMQIRYSIDGQTATRRHEQLKLNIDIGKSIFKSYGFDLNEIDEMILNFFIQHNYSVSPGFLIKIIAWLDDLNHRNTNLNIFPEHAFANEIEYQKWDFIKKYFLNNKITKKMHSFICLPYKYKFKIMNYYVKKLI